MQTVTYINPLKPGKLEAYKTFSAELLGERKSEYLDLLKRYGLKTAKVFYHKMNDIELIVIMHDAEDDATERLTKFTESEHPFDQWFVTKLTELHDFSNSEEGTQTQNLFEIEAK